MDQLFSDSLPFIAGGLAVGVAVAFVPRQQRIARRLSRALLALAIAHPLAVLCIYAGRDHIGESYGYLIAGALVEIMIGIVAALVLLAWLVLYYRDFHSKSKNETQQ